MLNEQSGDERDDVDDWTCGDGSNGVNASVGGNEDAYACDYQVGDGARIAAKRHLGDDPQNGYAWRIGNDTACVTAMNSGDEG